MSAPRDFIEVTITETGESLPCLVAVSEIAAIRSAGTYGHAVKSIIILKGGATLSLATEFDSVAERLARMNEKEG